MVGRVEYEGRYKYIYIYYKFVTYYTVKLTLSSLDCLLLRSFVWHNLGPRFKMSLIKSFSVICMFIPEPNTWHKMSYCFFFVHVFIVNISWPNRIWILGGSSSCKIKIFWYNVKSIKVYNMFLFYLYIMKNLSKIWSLSFSIFFSSILLWICS